MLAIPVDNWGEFVPDHILNILLNAVKGNLLFENVSEIIEVNTFEDKINSNTTISSLISTNNNNNDSNLNSNTYQTKIIPFDELNLNINKIIFNNNNYNVRNNKRQDIIICCTFIDKVTNIAGITRTCEIFNVKELLIPNIKIINSNEYISLSVASCKWLPLREINRNNIFNYLYIMKYHHNYQLIGIEQTNSSILLNEITTQTLHEINYNKCILVLGNEKEGIPLNILNMIDVCIEIPQYGVTRSLNVHVSLALIIWEFTKQNIKLGNI